MKHLNVKIGNEKIHNILKETIGNRRYNHSIGVAKTAIELSKEYGYSKKKAGLTGLLHDCGKFEDVNKILKMSNEFGIIQDSIMQENIGLLHGPLGSILAKKIYDVEDEEILNAISIHTTGKTKMNLLEKIIYLADYIEPGRVFLGVEDIRKLAYIDLDKALLLAMGNSIKYVVDKGLMLHKNTIEARNDLILTLKEKGR